MTPSSTIALIYGIGGSIFLTAFFIAFVTTGARALWYLRHNEPMPVLLPRDVVTKGGMFMSFGLISILRFYPPEVRTAYTTGNVGWALITTVPAVIAILTYVYFELFVIPRDTA